LARRVERSSCPVHSNNCRSVASTPGLADVSFLAGADDGSMIVGIGTDLVEVGRIQRSIKRWGERFLNRVYTERERAYASRKANAAERFAARFAAKEAGMKAIGTGWNLGVTWKDFEVVNQASGRPTVRLSGVAQQIANHLGVEHISISLTHTAEMAFAVVILERP
jgi:holo-[acyl-carrier protein] synthase